ncbi:hypothetical protein CBR_g54904 [Chara braunii]|uniref:Reverse transcriptase/retrotransposon-derived protein RNase H-like domain-containing protein n=1 Tax=Chara braunii TaxID=69332 RepID=A0A388JQ12_CHABU|nr:hypothetical protein CBR_g54904 [Chara braunii]|eukprot:GBG59802.1 hypothetical protein CBR_g54904 [Chara braunii]
MTGSSLGMTGQLAGESIDEYHQRFLAQLALIEAESELEKQHQELANLRQTVQNHKDLHEDATRTLHSRVQDLEQAAPRPDAGESSSVPSTRQLQQRVDHVVAMLGDISTFAAPATISEQLGTLQTELMQLHQPPDNDRSTSGSKHYKMPTFQIEKFHDYTHQDPVVWWDDFTRELGIHEVPEYLFISALFLNVKGGCHMATIYDVQVNHLYKKISWKDMTREWKKRFIVDDAPTLAITRLFTMTQGNTPIRDWLMKWQKIVATLNLELPFSHLRRDFYNRSCAAFSLALGDREQYTTFAEFIDKAREIIKTNRAAAQEKSAWQPAYVKKGKFGPRPQHVAAVQPDNIVEDPATTLASREGDQVAVVQPRSNNNSRGKGKAKTALPARNGQPAPRVKFNLTKAEYKWRSRIAAPLTRLQSPTVPFVFDDYEQRSFQTLKTTMLMAPVLSIYDPTLPTRVTIDASGYVIGAVLEQHDGDDWHPVEYFSHKVPPINSLDDARKKELLAFVMAHKRWRHFLLGRHRFTWVTDNNPLTYYKTQDTMSSTIGRWMYFIDQFDFTLKHLVGLSNGAADALSRRPDLCAMTHHASAFNEELQRHFIRGYESDPDFATLYALLSSDHPPTSHYRIVNGYLLLHSQGKDLLCVP